MLTKVLVGMLASGTLLLSPLQAFGVSNVSTGASQVTSAGIVAPMAFTDCDYGYRAATVSTSLSNGTVTSVFCRSSNRLLMQAKTRYAKSAGSAVTLRNYWEWTNSNGGTSVRRQVSLEYTIAPGNPDKITTWSYPSGLGAPDSSNKCNRGGVRVTSDGSNFSTRVTCSVTN